jgi:hypothetical protein
MSEEDKNQDQPKQDPPKDAKPAPEPNVIFVGKKKEGGKLVGIEDPELVPTWRRDGSVQFKLPSGEEQLAGFYHPEAARLISAFPADFKTFRKKG